MLDFTIRKIKPEDGKAVIAIDAIYSGKAKPEYWEERLKLFFGSSKKQVRLGYAAVAAAKVIGYILAEARAWEFGSPECGWIFAIGVDPKAARRGVGLALCREVCLKFKTLGIHTVRTMVRKDDVNVLSFFRASGFRAGPFVEMELQL
jgi:ribosomal protein S18 acetylase RimI-like enzyme